MFSRPALPRLFGRWSTQYQPTAQSRPSIYYGAVERAGLVWNMLCYASKFSVNGVQRKIAGFAMHGKALGGNKQRAFCTSGGTPTGFLDVDGMNQVVQPYGLGIAGGNVVPVFFAGGTADPHIYQQPGGPPPDDAMIHTGGLDDAEATIAWLVVEHRLAPVATYVEMNYHCCPVNKRIDSIG
jgi:hypothetical protein